MHGYGSLKATSGRILRNVWASRGAVRSCKRSGGSETPLKIGLATATRPRPYAHTNISTSEPDLNLSRAATSGSPFVASHATDSILWETWGPRVFDQARERNVPILCISSSGLLGRASMRAWSSGIFQHPDRAKLLRKHFIPVLLDRDEHPHVDAALAAYTGEQAGTGAAGWPYAVFLHPETRAPLAAALPGNPTALPPGGEQVQPVAAAAGAKQETNSTSSSQQDPSRNRDDEDISPNPPTVRGLIAQARIVAEAWTRDGGRSAMHRAGQQWMQQQQDRQNSIPWTDGEGTSSSSSPHPPASLLPRRSEVSRAASLAHGACLGQFSGRVDPLHGGEGSIPKMPRPVRIRAVLAGIAAQCDAFAAMRSRLQTVRAWRDLRSMRRRDGANVRDAELAAAKDDFEKEEQNLLAAAASASLENASTTAQVAFMITSSMKLDLLDRGYTAAEIKQLRPAEAQQILARPPGATAVDETETDAGAETADSSGSNGPDPLAGFKTRRDEALNSMQESMDEASARDGEQAAQDTGAVLAEEAQIAAAFSESDGEVAPLLQGSHPMLMAATRELLRPALRSDHAVAGHGGRGISGGERSLAWGGLLSAGEDKERESGEGGGADDVLLPPPMLRRGGGVHVLQARLAEVWFSLRRMLQGAYHDHVRGGFHRYARDRRWRLPASCEVMAEDQADMAITLIDGYQCTKDPVLANAAESALGRCLRDMRTEGGGFLTGLGPRASAEGANGSGLSGTETGVQRGKGGHSTLGEMDATRARLLDAIHASGQPPAAPVLLPGLWTTDEVMSALAPLLEHSGGLDEHGLPVRLSNRGKPAAEDAGAPSQPVFRWRDADVLACAHFGLRPQGNVTDAIATGDPNLQSDDQAREQARAQGWLGVWAKSVGGRVQIEAGKSPAVDGPLIAEDDADDDFAPPRPVAGIKQNGTSAAATGVAGNRDGRDSRLRAPMLPSTGMNTLSECSSPEGLAGALRGSGLMPRITTAAATAAIAEVKECLRKAADTDPYRSLVPYPLVLTYSHARVTEAMARAAGVLPLVPLEGPGASTESESTHYLDPRRAIEGLQQRKQTHDAMMQLQLAATADTGLDERVRRAVLGGEERILAAHTMAEFAEGSRSRYLDAATEAAEFARDRLGVEITASSGHGGPGTTLDGLRRGYSTRRPGTVGAGGHLEDYTSMIAALLEVHSACGDAAWLEWAVRLQHTQDRLFWGGTWSGYYGCSLAQAGAYGIETGSISLNAAGEHGVGGARSQSDAAPRTGVGAGAAAGRERAAMSFESRRASPASESVRNLQRLALITGETRYTHRAREAAIPLLRIMTRDGTGEAAAEGAPSLGAVMESLAAWPEAEAGGGIAWGNEAGEGEGEAGSSGQIGLYTQGVLSPRRVAIASSDPRGYQAAALQYALFSRYHPGVVAAHTVRGERAQKPFLLAGLSGSTASTAGDTDGDGDVSGGIGSVIGNNFDGIDARSWDSVRFETLRDPQGSGADLPQAYVLESDMLGAVRRVASTPEPGQLVQLLSPAVHVAMRGGVDSMSGGIHVDEDSQDANRDIRQ